MATTKVLEDVDLALVIQGAQDMNSTRHVSAVGLVLLIYEQILTFSDAVDFIRNAPPSYAKVVFLLNRYLVPVTQICGAIFMNRFSGGDISNLSCRIVLLFTFVMGIISIASGNVLVMLRVVTLWDRDHYIARLMAFGFCTSFLATVGFVIYVGYKSLPGIVYAPYLHSCVSTIKEPALSAVWASSLVFEALVLTLVIYHALSLPRGTNTPLRRILLRDGILFLSALAILRAANLIISIIARPSLVWSGAFFIWAMTTVVLNRSLLSIHKASLEAAHARLASTRKNNAGPSDQDLDLDDRPLPDLLEATGRSTPAVHDIGSSGNDRYYSSSGSRAYRIGSLDGLRRDATEESFGIELLTR